MNYHFFNQSSQSRDVTFDASKGNKRMLMIKLALLPTREVKAGRVQSGYYFWETKGLIIQAVRKVQQAIYLKFVFHIEWKQQLLKERSIYPRINPQSSSTLRIRMWLQISCMPRWREFFISVYYCLHFAFIMVRGRSDCWVLAGSECQHCLDYINRELTFRTCSKAVRIGLLVTTSQLKLS